MVKNIYRESKTWDIESYTIFRINGKDCEGIQISRVKLYNTNHDCKIGYSYWRFEDTITGHEFDNDNSIDEFIEKNETNGFSCGVYDSLQEVLADMEYINLTEEEKAYFTNNL